jgi:hypothetical protein
MNWADYKQVYLNYQLSVIQTRLISIVLTEILRDFPKNIPKNLSDPAFRKLKEVVDAIASFDKNRSVSHADKTGKKSHKNRNKMSAVEGKGETVSESAGALAFEILTLATTMVALDRHKKLKDIDFQRTQSFQELVMHYSHFEGILTDSLRAICSVRPEVMRKKRTIEIEEVLSCGCWDNLVDMLTERYVRAMSWGSLEKKLDTLKNHFRLGFQIDAEGHRVLREVELIRNLIVHNAGKANSEYITLRNAKGLRVGDYIPLDSEYLKYVSTKLNVIASEVYIEISKKYFGQKEEKVIECIVTNRGS